MAPTPGIMPNRKAITGELPLMGLVGGGGGAVQGLSFTRGGGGGAAEVAAGACSSQNTVPAAGRRQTAQSGLPQDRQKETTAASGWLAQVMVDVGLIFSFSPRAHPR